MAYIPLYKLWLTAITLHVIATGRCALFWGSVVGMLMASKFCTRWPRVNRRKWGQTFVAPDPKGNLLEISALSLSALTYFALWPWHLMCWWFDCWKCLSRSCLWANMEAGQLEHDVFQHWPLLVHLIRIQQLPNCLQQFTFPKIRSFGSSTKRLSGFENFGRGLICEFAV